MILPAERRRALTAKAQTYAASVEQALPYLLSRGISREVAAMFCLGYVTEGEYVGRLSIPYITPGGVVQIKFRCTKHDDANHKHVPPEGVKCQKYLYPAGSGTYLYNAQVLITAEKVVVTEGELDAICVQAYTGIPGVGYPGADTFKSQHHWRHCFEGVQEVIVVADGDDPGKRAARQVAEIIGLSARVVELPPGEDSNSYIAGQGAGAFLERIR